MRLIIGEWKYWIKRFFVQILFKILSYFKSKLDNMLDFLSLRVNNRWSFGEYNYVYKILKYNVINDVKIYV